jgi:hypothetical protein
MSMPTHSRGLRSRAAGGAVARQFAGPSGLAGHLVTWLLARGNARFNRWLVQEVAATVTAPATVIELGCGPGIARWLNCCALTPPPASSAPTLRPSCRAARGAATRAPSPRAA